MIIDSRHNSCNKLQIYKLLRKMLKPVTIKLSLLLHRHLQIRALVKKLLKSKGRVIISHLRLLRDGMFFSPIFGHSLGVKKRGIK